MRRDVTRWLEAELLNRPGQLLMIGGHPGRLVQGLRERHRLRFVLSGSTARADRAAPDSFARDGLEAEPIERFLAESTPGDVDAVLGLGLLGELGEIADGAALLRAMAERHPEMRIVLVELSEEGPETAARETASIEARVAAVFEEGFRVVREQRLEHGFRLLSLRLDGYRMHAFAGDEAAAILELFERSFHHRCSHDRWRWKYRENPWGNERITVARGPGGELVGQYCAYPVPFVRHAASVVERLLAHQVGDTMTAPSARLVGRGATSVLARAARHFYARFCEDRVDFNYGFNTGNIHRFSLRFVGAREVEPVPYWTRDLGGHPLNRRRLLARRRSYQVEPWEQAGRDPGLDELAARTVGAYGCLVERSHEYLAWRYLACPDALYRVYLVRRRGRLVGFGVFRQLEDMLLWGDALFHPSEEGAAEAVLRVAAGEATAARRIAGWFSHRPAWWRATLERLAFVSGREPNGLVMVVVPFRCREAQTLLQEELYYTMGDSDLF